MDYDSKNASGSADCGTFFFSLKKRLWEFRARQNPPKKRLWEFRARQNPPEKRLWEFRARQNPPEKLLYTTTTTTTKKYRKGYTKKPSNMGHFRSIWGHLRLNFSILDLQFFDFSKSVRNRPENIPRPSQNHPQNIPNPSQNFRCFRFLLVRNFRIFFWWIFNGEFGFYKFWECRFRGCSKKSRIFTHSGSAVSRVVRKSPGFLHYYYYYILL